MFAPNTKILVVDDMKTMRKIVTKHLNELGYTNLVEAEDGEAAWGVILGAAGTPNAVQVVISDWNMPKLKGIDLLKKIRSNDKTSNLPFIMVTAEVETDSENAAQATQLRVSGFLSKPFKKDDLSFILRSAFEHVRKAA